MESLKHSPVATLVGISYRHPTVQSALLIWHWCASFPSAAPLSLALQLGEADGKHVDGTACGRSHKNGVWEANALLCSESPHVCARYVDAGLRSPVLRTAEGYVSSELNAIIRYMWRTLSLSRATDPAFSQVAPSLKEKIAIERVMTLSAPVGCAPSPELSAVKQGRCTQCNYQRYMFDDPLSAAEVESWLDLVVCRLCPLINSIVSTERSELKVVLKNALASDASELCVLLRVFEDRLRLVCSKQEESASHLECAKQKDSSIVSLWYFPVRDVFSSHTIVFLYTVATSVDILLALSSQRLVKSLTSVDPLEADRLATKFPLLLAHRRWIQEAGRDQCRTETSNESEGGDGESCLPFDHVQCGPFFRLCESFFL